MIFEVKYRKGTDNQVFDHLSRLEDESMHELGEKVEIDDAFPDDHILAASQDLITWFVDFSNYLESDVVLLALSFY